MSSRGILKNSSKRSMPWASAAFDEEIEKYMSLYSKSISEDKLSEVVEYTQAGNMENLRKLLQELDSTNWMYENSPGNTTALAKRG